MIYTLTLYLNSKLGRLILLIRSLGNLVVLISSKPITRAFSHLELRKNKRRPSKKVHLLTHEKITDYTGEERMMMIITDKLQLNFFLHFSNGIVEPCNMS